MKITRSSIHTFSIPLTGTVAVAAERLEKREGFILLIEDENGNRGYGEISPLPGLDRITPDRCREELEDFIKNPDNRHIKMNDWNPRAPFLGFLKDNKPYSPQVLFGIESALLTLLLKQELFPANSFFGNIRKGLSVPVNGLFYPEESAAKKEKQFRYIEESGFKTVKVKIGRLPAGIEINQIRELSDFMNGSVLMRLDGNRRMTPRDIDAYKKSLEGVMIEYYEDPYLQKSMFENNSVRVALDESLPDFIDPHSADLTGLPPAVRDIIIKISWGEGIHGIVRLIDSANTLGIKTILSSTFNTGAGISILGLISLFQDRILETAHGFDTYRYLREDLLKEKLTIERGRLFIPGSVFFSNHALDMDLLGEPVN